MLFRSIFLLNTIGLIPMYQASMIPAIIPKKYQFCIAGVASFATIFTISREESAPTAKVMKNSIASHVKCGHDSPGM